MLRFLLVLTALIALVWFAASQIPLGMVLNRLPLNAMGVEWTQSEGTIWDGRMSGVYLNGQPVGDVDLALRPMSLLAFAPALEVQWGGAGGRGAGVVTVRGEDRIEATDLRVEQQINALESLSNEVRSIGGIFRLSGGEVSIADGSCTAASGNVQTDTLARAAQQFGRTFSDLTGSISCENGAFSIDLSGDSPAGDTVEINAMATLYGRSDIDVVVNTEDDEIETLLARSGFSQSEGVWTYQYETAAVAGGRL
ncbi:MAG: type II secretion system protein N [Henriciella sp.]|uniref:type II secretion system protein N n=1 Tax=Henriciella sp. TaxID=1968823 RepID=UPI003C73FDA3